MSYDFHPDEVGLPDHLFGLPCAGSSAFVELLGVPWEATVSYGTGTGSCPTLLASLSSQLDYGLCGVERPWELPLRYRVLAGGWQAKSDALRTRVSPYQRRFGQVENHKDKQLCAEVDAMSASLHAAVSAEVQAVLTQNKLPILLGGEHSIALGGIRAASTHTPALGVLQIDAHMDLRPNYQSFKYSHASTMARVLDETAVRQLVQVGIRDYSPAEARLAANTEQVMVFYDDDIRAALFQGKPFAAIAHDIVRVLPDTIYVSIDIDGLSSTLQPNTGTPVAGGLSFAEWDYLMRALVAGGRRIIGADLCECTIGQTPAEADLCTRLLYRLAVYAACSQGILEVKKPLTDFQRK